MRQPRIGDRIKILPSKVYPPRLHGRVGRIIYANKTDVRFDIISQYGQPCFLHVNNCGTYWDFADEQMLFPFGAGHI